MKKLSTQIDLDAEVAALALYIRQKWSPIDNLDALCIDIRDEALKAARGWIAKYSIGEIALQRAQERIDVLERALPEPERTFVRWHDGVSHLFLAIYQTGDQIVECGRNLDGPWDFGRAVSALTSRMRNAYPELANTRPLGWEVLADGYNDFDGQEGYDARADEALFEGVDVCGDRSPSFTGRTALPSVIYDDKCQGRAPAETLVGAVFAHFLGIREYLNTQALVQSIREIEVPIHAEEILFDVHTVSDNPFLHTMLQIIDEAPTRASFEKTLANAREYAALSASEKAKRDEEHAERMKAIIDEIVRDSGTTPEEDAGALRMRTLLIQSLEKESAPRLSHPAGNRSPSSMDKQTA